MTSPFCPVIGRAYRVARRPENDERAHVTVTDLCSAVGRETVVRFVDGFGNAKTLTVTDFAAFLGHAAPKPAPKPPAQTIRSTSSPVAAKIRPTTPPKDF